MKETEFIQHNKKKWNRFEELYESKSNDPEELSDLYMDITDDLSYAQTFYPKRTVRVYLNQLAQKVYTGVHKQKGESFRKFFTVWKTSLPLEIYRSRKNLLFALIAFLVYVAIGVLTTAVDPDFPRQVLGDGYVDMTIQNIQRGNPLAVYESATQMDMFIQITSNNMKVAFLTFVVGFFFTFGTHILLFYNGVMLGAFQYFFHLKGLLITSFLGIWIHGAFEISAIVLAAGAGITAGNGLLFPKSYTRLQSLQLSTKRGLKIMMSLVPFIVIAGFLESYVTHNYQVLPDWSKWMLIILSFAIVLFLYVFYPIYVARKNPELVNREEIALFKEKSTFNFNKIRNTAENLADSFRLFTAEFKSFFRLNITVTFPIVIALIILQAYNHFDLQQTEYWYDWSAQLEFLIGYGFYNLQDIIVCGIWMLLFTYVFTSIYWIVANQGNEFSWKSFRQFLMKKFIAVFIANLILMSIVLLLPWQFLIFAFFFIPFFLLNGATMALGEGSFGKRFKKGFKYSKQHYGNSLLTLIVLIALTIILMQPIAFVFSIHDYSDKPMIPDLLDFVTEFIKRVAQLYTDNYIIYANIFRQVIYVIFMFAILPILIYSTAFAFFSQMERNEAVGLRKAFEKFGKRSRTHEKEVDFDD